MEDSTYSSLGNKQRNNFPPIAGLANGTEGEVLLANIIEDYSKSGWEKLEVKDLLKSLIFEFKSLLEVENLRDLIQDLIQIDHSLHIILDHANLPDEDLELGGFYQNLSTVFIRMALEEEINEDSMKRSIEIGLEEEIYSWQERLQ